MSFHYGDRVIVDHLVADTVSLRGGETGTLIDPKGVDGWLTMRLDEAPFDPDDCITRDGYRYCIQVKEEEIKLLFDDADFVPSDQSLEVLLL